MASFLLLCGTVGCAFRSRLAGFIASFVAALGVSVCAPDYDTDSLAPATGGAPTGGAPATGGFAGASGCSHTSVPSNGRITDFSEVAVETTWTSGTQDWGNAGSLTGETFHYGSGAVLTATMTTTGALNLSATMAGGDYVGLGLSFAACSDASSFDGIGFAMWGDLGSADFEFQVQTSRNYPISTTESRGECEYAFEQTMWSDCSSNYVVIAEMPTTPGEGQFEFSWPEITDGVPTSPVDPTELLGIQWQFSCARGGSDCTIDVQIDDINFFPS